MTDARAAILTTRRPPCRRPSQAWPTGLKRMSNLFYLHTIVTLHVMSSVIACRRVYLVTGGSTQDLELVVCVYLVIGLGFNGHPHAYSCGDTRIPHCLPDHRPRL